MRCTGRTSLMTFKTLKTVVVTVAALLQHNQSYHPTINDPINAIWSNCLWLFSIHGMLLSNRFWSFVLLDRSLKGTDDSGSAGLCTTLRKLFSTFGVPREVSSDEKPEFSAKKTPKHPSCDGVSTTESYLPSSSNGRAKVAVKSTKRLLMKNISSDGSLDIDNMVRALLMLRNTPDPTCKLSQLRSSSVDAY